MKLHLLAFGLIHHTSHLTGFDPYSSQQAIKLFDLITLKLVEVLTGLEGQWLPEAFSAVHLLLHHVAGKESHSMLRIMSIYVDI